MKRMPEPYNLEDQRQRAWDRSIENCPQCHNCGAVILPGERVLRYKGLVLCGDCLIDYTDIYDDLED